MFLVGWHIYFGLWLELVLGDEEKTAHVRQSFDCPTQAFITPTTTDTSTKCDLW
jgi:hypothetical protein